MSRANGILVHLQFEDVLLFIWLVVVTPLLQRALGGAMRNLSLDSINRAAPHALELGIVFLLATLLAAACTITRAPGDGQGAGLIGDTPFGYAHLPMLAGIGIMSFLGLDFLGLDDAAIGLMCAWFALFGLAAMVYRHMPVIDYILRRMLMTPFTILSTTVFTSSAGLFLSGVNANNLFQLLQSDLGRFEFGLTLAGVLVYYLMFVLAPRQIAGSGGSWLQWAVRFALYVVGVILNIGFLQGV